MNESSWFLYVVKCSDDSLYTGVTTDVKRRLHEHNTSPRGAKYTRSRRPVVLVYCKTYKNRSDAQKAEFKFKSLRRSQKLAKIKENIRMF